MDVRRNDERHRYEVDTGRGMAFLEFAEPREGVIDLVHTFVPRTARGGGFAEALVQTALDRARADGLRIIATCPYVRSWLERHPEYLDLVAERGPSSRH